jgi:DNA-binding MltR family transcriptional regulator
MIDIPALTEEDLNLRGININGFEQLKSFLVNEFSVFYEGYKQIIVEISADNIAVDDYLQLLLDVNKQLMITTLQLSFVYNLRVVPRNIPQD